MNNKIKIKLDDYVRGYLDGVQETCTTCIHVLKQLEGLNEITIDGKELMKIIIEGSR